MGATLPVLANPEHLGADLGQLAVLEIGGDGAELLAVVRPFLLVQGDNGRGAIGGGIYGLGFLFYVASCNNPCNLLCNFAPDGCANILTIAPAFRCGSLLDGLVGDTPLGCAPRTRRALWH